MDKLNLCTLNYRQFCHNYPFQEEVIYRWLFMQYKADMKLSKEKFAIKNLQTIFNAVFSITTKTGYQAMSLRDLSAVSGLSMGGLYSTIMNKEMIVVMVKDVVAEACQQVVDDADQLEESSERVRALVKGYIFVSTLLQPWFNFLYFETRSLPEREMQASKDIEYQQVRVLDSALSALEKEGATHSTGFITTMTLAMIQERYLKSWKYKQTMGSVDQYAEDCLRAIAQLGMVSLKP